MNMSYCTIVSIVINLVFGSALVAVFELAVEGTIRLRQVGI